MANKWLSHVKKTMKMMKRKGTYKKGMGLSQVIKEAKKSWHKRGGAGEPNNEPTGVNVPTDNIPKGETNEIEETEGGRRHRKTRRHRARKH